MKIYVACPSDTVTGGPELLHQLAAELNKHDGIEAVIFDPMSQVCRVPQVYAEQYKNPIAAKPPDIEDFVIYPEIWARLANVRPGNNAIYWMSVDNYFPHTPKSEWFRFKPGILHIAQSKYSIDFLTDVLSVDPDQIIVITDYVNEDYLESDIDTMRKPAVLYNPAKGMEYTEKIIALAPDIDFVPIRGMARHEIRDLMLHSMVYIDFGSFPGKDRLPREAGACGMCLITGRRGTARYSQDLNLHSGYKIHEANYADLGKVVEIIRDIFANFELHQKRFAGYRASVRAERDKFRAGVQNLAEVLR